MIAETTAFTIEGINAKPVRVRAEVIRGLPAFQIIGVPDAAAREVREIVRSAVTNSGFEFPLRRIEVTVTPASKHRAGHGIHLAIAAAVLAAAGEIAADDLAGYGLVGDLALDGTLRPVRGALAMAEAAYQMGKHGIIVPPSNGRESAFALGIDVRTISEVSQLKTFGHTGSRGEPPVPFDFSTNGNLPDLKDLRGQEHLCDGLEVAAAGGHCLLMIGPPGSGKSLAARRLPSILPPLDGAEILEVARIGSVSGVGERLLSGNRPYRAPHHTVSAAGLVGGGSPVRPGEVTLAHKGVLFLDELPEFRREALDALRQPVETGEVDITRGGRTFTLPADFQLIAASNPCGCGRGPWDINCECSAASINRYQKALQGEITGNFDINIGVGIPSAEDIAAEPGRSSASVRDRVIAARERMAHRYGSSKTNAMANPADVAEFALAPAAREAINRDHQFQAARNIHRLLKVARTLADLAERSEIGEDDIGSAAGYTNGKEQFVSPAPFF